MVGGAGGGGCVCWSSSNIGLCSFGCCSGMSSLLWCKICMFFFRMEVGGMFCRFVSGVSLCPICCHIRAYS
jgi:hypothetical protein